MSQHHLNLLLYCRTGTPVGEMLDVWPPMPIVIVIRIGGEDYARDVDNVIARDTQHSSKAISYLDSTSHFSAQSTGDPLSHPLAGRSKPMYERGLVEVTSHCLCVASCNHDLTAIFVRADINVCRTLNDFF